MKRAKRGKQPSAEIMSVLNRQQMNALADQMLHQYLALTIGTLETLADDFEGKAQQSADFAEQAPDGSYEQAMALGTRDAFTYAAANLRAAVLLARQQ